MEEIHSIGGVSMRIYKCLYISSGPDIDKANHFTFPNKTNQFFITRW